MNFIDSIINICLNNSDKIDTKNNNVDKATLLNYYSFISLIILFIFTAINFIEKNTSVLIVTISLFCIILINYLIFRKRY